MTDAQTPFLRTPLVPLRNDSAWSGVQERGIEQKCVHVCLASLSRQALTLLTEPFLENALRSGHAPSPSDFSHPTSRPTRWLDAGGRSGRLRQEDSRRP